MTTPRHIRELLYPWKSLGGTPAATEELAFDIASRHLIGQGQRSMVGTMPHYHTPDGFMCPVGSLISDDRYTEYLEWHPVGSFLVLEAVEASDLCSGLPDVRLLYGLRAIHDHVKPADWGVALNHLAYLWDLPVPYALT